VCGFGEDWFVGVVVVELSRCGLWSGLCCGFDSSLFSIGGDASVGVEGIEGDEGESVEEHEVAGSEKGEGESIGKMVSGSEGVEKVEGEGIEKVGGESVERVGGVESIGNMLRGVKTLEKGEDVAGDGVEEFEGDED